MKGIESKVHRSSHSGEERLERVGNPDPVWNGKAQRKPASRGQGVGGLWGEGSAVGVFHSAG